MAAANRKTYKRWVVEALTVLGTATPQQTYAWIRSNCPVPASDLTSLTADGEILFEKEIRFARLKLRHEGIVDGATRGQWKLL